MKNGCVKRRVIKCLIVGAAGVGKTTIKHLILKKELPKKRESTGVLENPAVGISISRDVSNLRAIMKPDNSEWYVVRDDEELIKMIAKLIKTGVSTLPVTSQEMSDSAGTTVEQGLFNSVVQDQDEREVDSAEKLLPKGAAKSRKDSIHNKVIREIVEAKGMYLVV